MDIQQIQRQLQKENIEGWLLYDFRGSNPLARAFLGISDDVITSRRFAYFIPVQGEPVKIVHAIEPYVLDHLPGEKKIYLKWQSWEKLFCDLARGKKRIAMEYSSLGRIPYVSKIDAGTIDLVRFAGAEVVSSAFFLQQYSSTWDAFQLKTHLFAAKVLEDVVEKVWNLIRHCLETDKELTEYAICLFIIEEFEKAGCVNEHFPICSVNAHSADPHYVASKDSSSLIKKGDFILIDIVCKQKKPRAVYADITRVAVASSKPTKKQQEIFDIVRKAQKMATEYVKRCKTSRGCDVDAICRKVIEDAGYGEFFLHRTGHNISTEIHGPGANLDSLETYDERLLLPKSCYSIEPGIYLPGEFGVRLEYDVYLSEEGDVLITGGIQEKIETLF